MQTLSGTRILVDLCGCVGLLLWGTHMVSTGIERGFGSALRRTLGRKLGNRMRAFLTGAGTTAPLSERAATGIIAASLPATDAIALAPALAALLGANVGSALFVQVMSLGAITIAPMVVLLGALALRRGESARRRNAVRTAIGLGLMVLALSGLQLALSPLASMPLAGSILGSLASQPVLVIVLSALLTWASHSSVAMVLLLGSLCASHLVGDSEIYALVLGANLGGVLPPLASASTVGSRRLPLGNLLVRSAGVLLLLPWLPVIAHVLREMGLGRERLAMDFHLAFNLGLAAVFLPNVHRGAALLLRWLPDPPRPSDPGKPNY
jgi:phosphate:Na+ symporter